MKKRERESFKQGDSMSRDMVLNMDANVFRTSLSGLKVL